MSKWYNSVTGLRRSLWGVAIGAGLLGYFIGQANAPTASPENEEPYRVDSVFLHEKDGKRYALISTNRGEDQTASSDDGTTYTNTQILNERNNAALRMDLRAAREGNGLEQRTNSN